MFNLGQVSLWPFSVIIDRDSWTSWWWKIRCFTAIKTEQKPRSGFIQWLILLSCHDLGYLHTPSPVNTKHLYNIFTMLNQRRRRWVDVVQMLFQCLLGRWRDEGGWSQHKSPHHARAFRRRLRVVTSVEISRYQPNQRGMNVNLNLVKVNCMGSRYISQNHAHAEIAGYLFYCSTAQKPWSISFSIIICVLYCFCSFILLPKDYWTFLFFVVLLGSQYLFS